MEPTILAHDAGVPSSNWLNLGERAEGGPLKQFAIRLRKAQADAENAGLPVIVPRPPGQPIECVPAVWRPIVEFVGLGMTCKTAAEVVDVPFSMVREWRKRGRHEREGPYREFVVALRKARVALSIRAIDSLNKAANAGKVEAMKYLHRLSGDGAGDPLLDSRDLYTPEE